MSMTANMTATCIVVAMIRPGRPYSAPPTSPSVLTRSCSSCFPWVRWMTSSVSFATRELQPSHPNWTISANAHPRVAYANGSATTAPLI